MTDAIKAIAAERKRQVEQEGWTHKHDDNHSDGSLAQAAACYANPMTINVRPETTYSNDIHPNDDEQMPIGWPYCWDSYWWRPTNRRRDLVKAGALIVAEIERLDRLSEQETDT